MQVDIVKSPYAAPEARRTRVRPFVPASSRRRPLSTWKDSAQAALGVPVKTTSAIVIAEITSAIPRPEAAQVRGRPARHSWEWWQVIAPVIITVCAIGQLAQSIR